MKFRQRIFSLLIVCGLFTAGCTSAGTLSRKPYITPVNLPGMGGAKTEAAPLRPDMTVEILSDKPLNISASQNVYELSIPANENKSGADQKATLNIIEKSKDQLPAFSRPKTADASIVVPKSQLELDVLPAAPEMVLPYIVERSTAETELPAITNKPQEQQAREIIPEIKPDAAAEENGRISSENNAVTREIILPAPVIKEEKIIIDIDDKDVKAAPIETIPKVITPSPLPPKERGGRVVLPAGKDRPAVNKPPAPVNAANHKSVRIHTVAASDNLQSLAEKYYGDKENWIKIYEANKDRIEKGSLQTGQTILIP